LIKSAVSIVLTSELGLVPTNAGRTSGRVGVGDGDGDPPAVLGVCDVAKPELSSTPTKQNIPSRMAK
jgi:hypothetical protein